MVLFYLKIINRQSLVKLKLVNLPHINSFFKCCYILLGSVCTFYLIQTVMWQPGIFMQFGRLGSINPYPSQISVVKCHMLYLHAIQYQIWTTDTKLLESYLAIRLSSYHLEHLLSLSGKHWDLRVSICDEFLLVQWSVLLIYNYFVYMTMK